MSILDQVSQASYAFRAARASLLQLMGRPNESWARGYAQGVLIALWEQDVITEEQRDAAGKALDAMQGGRRHG